MIVVVYRVNKVYDTCEENPSVTSCAKIAEIVRPFDPDFFIACGGGSAIDTTKAVSVLLKYPGEDPYDVFYEKGGPSFTSLGYDDADVPIVTIPTTAGTGSEISPFSVLTNEKIDNKLGIGQVVYPKVAFLDAKYIKGAPPRLIHSGAIDALAHGVETYVNVSSNPMLNAFAEAGFKMFASYNYETSSFLDSAKIGIRYLDGKCDRLFITPVQTRFARRKALLVLADRPADVVVPLLDGEEDSPLLLSNKVCRWSLIYNGLKGIDGAWQSLVRIKAATVERLNVSEDIYRDHLPRKGSQAVINWI